MKTKIAPLNFIIGLLTITALSSCSGISLGASGGGGGTGLSVGTNFSGNAEADPEAVQYRDRIKSLVESNLNWNEAAVEKPCKLRFRVDESGKVSNISQRSSSKNTMFDQAAIAALERSSPLPPPPEFVVKSFSYIEISVEPSGRKLN